MIKTTEEEGEMEDDAEGCGRGEAGVGIVGGNRYSNWYIKYM